MSSRTNMPVYSNIVAVGGCEQLKANAVMSFEFAVAESYFGTRGSALIPGDT